MNTETDNDSALELAEAKAIRSLKRLATIWPESLWVFAASGTLWVMKKEGGKKMFAGEGVDQDFCLGRINIECDGGDW